MAITYYSRPQYGFTDLYIAVRKKENRLYSEMEIQSLPDLDKNHPHYDEWQLRKKSAGRFLRYLSDKKKPLKILDIGCGNGWFSHLMSTIASTEVTAIDVNTTELEQADKVFQKENLAFACADLSELTQLNGLRFDQIVFNSCFQYFENAQQLLVTVQSLLAENGEIHIIDTPFYDEKEIASARQRTEMYYENLGFPEMSLHYFHHLFSELGKYTIIYSPPAAFLRYLKKDSPFPWIMIEKQNPEKPI